MDEETAPAVPESTAIVNAAPYVINDVDRAGLIVVLTTFCLISAWIIFVIRAYIRLKLNGPWKIDDTCVAIATMFTTVRSAIVYLEVRRGYGRSSELLEAGAVEGIGKALFADFVLFFLAMLFSKCAVLFLCQRMTPKQEHWVAIGTIFLLAVFWMVGSVLLLSINCHPGFPWVDVASQCTNLATRWKVICAFDIVSEFLIFSCSIYLVHGLHMSWGLKLMVITAFAIRLPTALLSGLHLRSILKEITAPDPTLAGAVTSAWRQLELDFAIVACTLSSLGAFLKPFDNDLGPSRSGSNQVLSNSQNYQMNSLRSGNHVSHSHKPASEGSVVVPILRPDPSSNIATATCNTTTSERASVESNDSKKGIIMKKQWVVDRGGKDSPDGLRKGD